MADCNDLDSEQARLRNLYGACDDESLMQMKSDELHPPIAINPNVDKTYRDEARRRLRQNRITMYIAVTATLFIIVADWPGSWSILRQAGFVVLVVSVVLWCIARWELGSSFTRAPEAHKLITHGLYARIQNPVYLFGILTTVGTFLFLNHPVIAVCAGAILIPMQIVRADKERRVLAAAFGDEYEQYRKHTWF